MSKVTKNVFHGWEMNKRWIEDGKLHTLEDWKKVNIWGSAQASKDGIVRKANTKSKRLLWEDGYMRLGDLLSEQTGQLANWEQRMIKAGSSRALERREWITAGGRKLEMQKQPSERNLARWRCDEQAFEDTLHTFWNCPRARVTWSNVRTFVCQNLSGGWKPKCNQCILAEELPQRYRMRTEWWETLRGATMWAIWVARNAKVFSNDNWHGAKINGLLWYMFSIYLEQEWGRNTEKSTADQNEFAERWVFKGADITIDENGKLKLHRQAPWRRIDTRSEEVANPP
ncbi:hypothetical protein R1sor_021741 [Riccia sorocarpa]|uniref:Reverse transcriptase zinc-binding domain-containing protein n=1 Tax=Riccia sorocarpa TaxID=122646 RepID=A0ABD3GL07_9MARC